MSGGSPVEVDASGRGLETRYEGQERRVVESAGEAADDKVPRTGQFFGSELAYVFFGRD